MCLRLIFSVVLILFLFIQNKTIAQDQKTIDSLFNELETVQADTIKVKVLFRLTWEHLKSRSELSMARAFADSARSLSKRIGYDEGAVYVNYYYGVLGRLEGNYGEALNHFKTFETYYENKGDSGRVASSLYHMAVIYSYQGNYDQSLKTYFRTLKIYEVDRDPYMIATTLNSIGIIYKNMNKYEPALESYKEALVIFDSLEAKIDIADCLHNIGNVYALQNDHPQALDYFNRALELDKELDNKWGIAYQLESLGNVYADVNQYEQALSHHLQALEIRQQLEQKKEIASSLVKVGNASYELGQTEQAIEYLKQSIALSLEIGAKPELRDAYLNISNAYAKNKQFAQAFDYQQRYVQIKDSLLNEEMTRQINELQTLYETEKKEQEIQILNQKQQIQEAEILQQTTLKNAFIVGFILLAILIFVLIWNYRQKLKAKEMLARKNGEIHQQKIIEMEKNQKLYAMDAMISGQETERKRIARDLHDGLGALLATVQNQFSRISKEINSSGNVEVFNTSNAMLDEACKEVRKISHNMMPGTLMKLGLIPALEDMCAKINDSHDFNVDFQSFGMDMRLSETTEVTIYRLIQEALNNIIKHAKAKDVIVQLVKNEEKISITIEDDGIGFNVSDAINNGGMGMRNLDSRVKYLNGVLEIDSDVGAGTTINVEIPV